MRIVIEGVDGCGKSTVAKRVAEALRCEVMSFPNDDSPTGKLIREWLSGDWGSCYADIPEDQEAIIQDSVRAKRLDAMVFQSLQVANRMEVMGHLRNSYYEAIVLCRYWQSGWVYGQLDGLDRKWLMDVHRDMVQGNVNILLDLEPEVALERQAARNEAREVYEGDFEKTSRIVDLYRELWKIGNFGNALPGLWQTVDASKPLAEVIAETIATVGGARK